MDEPLPWSTWHHLKTGGLYTVLCVATCSTNGHGDKTERSVVYLSHTKHRIWYRELSQFMDGRFERVDPST